MLFHISGISAADNWDRFKQQYGFEEDTTVLSRKKNELHYKFLKDKVTAMPGLIDLFKLLRANKFEIGIASSSIRPHIDLVVEVLGISNYIGAIASGDEVTRSKPAPDIFLKAASKLGVSPKECVVFEDAMNGMKAAKAAKMRVIVVPNIFTLHEDFTPADRVVPTLEKVDMEMLSSLG